MSAQVVFIGYVEYAPKQVHAEFIVVSTAQTGILPDGAQVNWDTLRALKIPIPAFPTYHEWVKGRWEQMVNNQAFLNTFRPEPK